MMDSSHEVLSNDSLLTAYYMPRPRIDEILDRATQCKLVYVIAGAGYGKTQAIRSYIEQQTDAIVRWIQLTDSDNICSRYWENLIHSISYDNQDLADRLREFGFPDTLARFKQFAEILKSTEHRAVKTYLVLDDFHLVHSEQALLFAERCAYLHVPGACVVIISRKEPEINTVSLFSKGQVHIVTEDELRFTDDEILEFLKQRSIDFSVKNLPRLIDATKGWALAIQLISLSLKRNPRNLDSAIENMKQNIFKLMEIEAFNDFPENTKKLLIKISLVSNMPLTILQKLFGEVLFLRDLPQLASFLWFDSFSGSDRIHPLYLEFLHDKQDALTFEEKRVIYRDAAQWCSDNNFNLDAMRFFSQAQDYGRMVELLYTYPFRLPYDTCEYFLDIIENLAPDEENIEDLNLLMLINFFAPLLLMGMGKLGEARQRSFRVIRKWAHSDSPFAPIILASSYSNLVYIDMYTCTITHKYNSPKYLKKSIEFYKKSTLPLSRGSGAFTVPDIRSLACLVGEGADLNEFEQFLGAVKLTEFYIGETFHNMYSGYEDLVSCELAFYRNQPDVAKNHAHQSIVKAREKNQYSIEAMAEQYLLRISTQEGDYQMVKEVLRQLRSHLDNPDFWSRQLLYDLFTGFFYAQIGLPGMAPSWLIMDEKEAKAEVRIPVRELVVCVKNHIATKKYHQALTVLGNSYPRKPQERFLLSELTFSLLSAVARINTGDTEGAMNDFNKAYSLSFNGVFEMPFIELGKNLRPLVAAALNKAGAGKKESAQAGATGQAGSGQADAGQIGAKPAKPVIPDVWLKTIDRKASVYAKKAAFITNSFKKEEKIDDSIQLSDREQEVLNDLYHGLSREEISVNRYLSINTVKKLLQSVYIKLNASNNVDAVRIALEKNLIE
ncbi:MAG: LuxR C-terminal-related transcriptional regulator [Synergistaceae bacterium]|nr:LuxR C-terminal-related transcriptional regulator [Synergistaceae bacterium]